MSFSTLDLLSIVLTVVMFGFGLFSLALLFVPSVEQWMLRRRVGSTQPSPDQRRAARASLLCSAAICFAFGVNFLARSFMPFVCDGQNALQIITFIALILPAALSILNLRFAKQLEKASPPPVKKPNPILVGVFTVGIFALALGVPFFYLTYSLNRPFETLEQIEMTSELEGWALGSSSFTGIMYRYRDGSWQRESIPHIGLLTGLSMSSPQAGWAVSDSDQMLQYKDGGWSIQQVPVGELRNIELISDEEGWAVGNHGVILHYLDGTWQQVNSPTSIGLEGVAMVSATDGWIVGGGGFASGNSSIILRYQSGEWKGYPNPTTLPLSAVHVVSPTEAWAVGGTRFPIAQSVILHFRQNEWVVVPNPTHVPLSAVNVSPTGEGWAVGGGFFSVPLQCESSRQTERLTALLRYDDGAWTTYSDYADVALHDIAMTGADSGWIVGWNTFWKLERGRWSEAQTVP